MLRIIGLLSSCAGGSLLVSVVAYLLLAEAGFSVPSNAGLFLKAYLFAGFFFGKPFLCLFPHSGTS